MPIVPYDLDRGEEDLIELEVDYEVSPYVPARTYGPPEDCYPAEGGELEEYTVTRDGKPFELTPEEDAVLEQWLIDQHDPAEHARDEAAERAEYLADLRRDDMGWGS